MELTIKELMMKRLQEEQACIIQLEMGNYDYSLSEIARIVEDDDTKVVALSIDPVEGEPGRILVNVMVNKPDCTSLIKSFYRYNYNVANTISSPSEDSDLLDRYTQLMRYLNV